MKVYVNKIDGWADALVSLLMSKRSYTREKELQIRQMVDAETDHMGCPLFTVSEKFVKNIERLFFYGIHEGHTTLLRYLDISITVEGVHRGAQDDFDAHAARMNNRIVRSSTRLAKFDDGEKCDWFNEKILYPFEAAAIAGIDMPESVVYKEQKYVKTDFGYVREDLIHEQDVKRGLYPLAIPSNFTCRIQYPELAHIYQHRCKFTGAHPELHEIMTELYTQLEAIYPGLGEGLAKLKMQPETTGWEE